MHEPIPRFPNPYVVFPIGNPANDASGGPPMWS